MPVDLTRTRATARRVAADWGLEPGEPFAMAHHSYAAPVGDDAVLKVGWEGDDESLHDADALELWDGVGAVRLLRRDDGRRATLLERARPGTDLAAIDEVEATAVAVERRDPAAGVPPGRRSGRSMPRSSAGSTRPRATGSELVPLARELHAEIGGRAGWVVHGDLHHHNLLRHGDRVVAIDPKPYLSDREYDVPRSCGTR